METRGLRLKVFQSVVAAAAIMMLLLPTSVSAQGAVPAAPSALTATIVNGNKINLTWTDNSNNETGFLIKGSGSFTATVGANVATYADTSVSPGHTYSYQIIAQNAVGDSTASNQVDVAISLPGVPGNLTSVLGAGPKVDLNWTDNSTDETSFLIERTGQGPPVSFTTAANATSYADTTTALNSNYSYKVSAVNIAGNSTPSNSISIKVAVPNVPSNLTVVAPSAVKVNLTWGDSDIETSYRIERSLNGTTFTTLTTLAANITSFSDSTVTANQIHYYRIVAINVLGPSAVSSVATVTPAVPAPTTVMPTAGGFTNDTTPDLVWSPMVDVTNVKYRVEIDNTANFSSPEYIGDALTVNNTTSTPLVSGHYYWRVRAVDEASNVSAWAQSEFTIDTVAPPTPVGVSPAAGSKLGGHDITFQWNGVTDPAGVKYHIVVFDVDIIIHDVTHITGTQITLTLYDNNWGWRVSAIDGAGNEGLPCKDIWFQVSNQDFSPPDLSVTSPNGVDNAPPDVTVTAPNGGEVLTGGSTFAITWYTLDDLTSTHQLKIEIYFSADNGRNWQAVAKLQANPGAFNWYVPNINTDQALIRVISIDHTLRAGLDASDFAFTIVSNPSLPLGQSAGEYRDPVFDQNLVIKGETLIGGQTWAITWYTLPADPTSTKDLKIDIFFSPDNGANFVLIVSLPDNPGAFRWYVPNINTNQGLIRVDATDKHNLTGRDVSDYVFTIIANPDQVFGLSSAWNSQNQVIIGWSHSGLNVTNFRIERSTNGFQTVDATFSVPANQRAFTDTTADSKKGYTYRVIAANGPSETPTAAPSISVAAVPAPPPPVVPPPPAGGGGGFGSGGGGTVIGGGGGGGFGAQLTGIGLLGTSPAMDGSGKTLDVAEFKTGDSKCVLSLPKNTIIRNQAGAAVFSISASRMEKAPAAPALGSVLYCYEFGPSGLTFNPAIDVEMYYSDGDLPAGMPESSIYIGMWDGAKWIKLPSTVDTLNNQVTAKVEHFSSFAVLAQAAPPTVQIVSPAANAPVPVGNVTIHVDAKNIQLTAPGGANVPGQGHLHYYLDVDIPTTPGQAATTPAGTYKVTNEDTVTWANLTPGTHRLGVQVVNNDHTPMVPPVTAQVTITVQAPPTTPPLTTTIPPYSPPVTQPVVTTPAATPSASGGTNWALIAGVIAAVLAIGLAFYLGGRTRKSV